MTDWLVHRSSWPPRKDWSFLMKAASVRGLLLRSCIKCKHTSHLAPCCVGNALSFVLDVRLELIGTLSTSSQLLTFPNRPKFLLYRRHASYSRTLYLSLSLGTRCIDNISFKLHSKCKHSQMYFSEMVRPYFFPSRFHVPRSSDRYHSIGTLYFV